MKTKISDVSFDYDYAFLKAPMYTFLGMCPIDNSDFIFEPVSLMEYLLTWLLEIFFIEGILCKIQNFTSIKWYTF